MKRVPIKNLVGPGPTKLHKQDCELLQYDLFQTIGALGICILLLILISIGYYSTLTGWVQYLVIIFIGCFIGLFIYGITLFIRRLRSPKCKKGKEGKK